MGRRRRYDGDNYHERLKDLKNKLKPFRNKHTTNCISTIMKSSSLSRHVDNILTILSSNPSNLTVQKCLQNVADDVTSQNHAKCTLPKLNITVDLDKKSNRVDFSSLVTTGNKTNHTYIKPSAFNSNTVSPGNNSCPAEVVNKMNHVPIDPFVNEFNTIHFGEKSTY